MHNQPNTSNTRTNISDISNIELGAVRSLFELLVKLPSHIRYNTIAWAIETKDPTMLQLVALCRWRSLRGYVHYYFLTPDKFRETLFTPRTTKLNAVEEPLRVVDVKWGSFEYLDSLSGKHRLLQVQALLQPL
jgi:hypothetical protein